MKQIVTTALVCALVLAGCGGKKHSAAPAKGSLPGAEPFSDELKAELAAAKNKLPEGYEPRTRHLEPDGAAKYTNRLLLESSPYLRQHAHNPVNWYPWGDEAFEAAKKSGRPVLLSIGYSTCHWCHVMEEESFEDEKIARYMNENYIAIKVDREERPDIDSIYMNAMSALKLGGGWPLNVWLTPDREPFYGGTYFPPFEDKHGRPGFLPKLKEARDVFAAKPDAIKATAAQVANALKASSAAPPGTAVPDAAALQTAAERYQKIFDPLYGGPAIKRGGSKFPSSMPVRFLLRHARRSGDAQFLSMAVLTLEKMAAGGMYDHFGGGFHRYSTDQRWLVPHFEKMLYDNALLAVSYLEAHQVTGRADFADVAREILGYVVRDMTSPDGGFYSATDADSLTPKGHREEGYFFTWTPAEIDSVLDPSAAAIIKKHYDITETGNFEGRSIPNTPTAVPDDVRAAVTAAKETLYQARKKRPPPLRDEKILAAWNGLMISAFARASRVLGKDETRGIDYLQHAVRAARFVLDDMRKDGRLLRTHSNGVAKLNAYLQDYAFVIAALLDLFEASGDSQWLTEAIALDEVLHAHYEDTKAGGFFLTSDDHEQLLTREKPYYDKAIPSGSSYAVMNLLRLYELTTRDTYLARADKALVSLAEVVNRAPTSASELLLALDFRLDAPKEIVIITPSSRAEAAPFLSVLASTFVPNHVLAVTPSGQPQSKVETLVPLVERKVPMKGKTTAYVCVRQACELPTSDPAVFAKQLLKTADQK